jgi:hypothetical protein
MRSNGKIVIDPLGPQTPPQPQDISHNSRSSKINYKNVMSEDEIYP